MNYKDGTKCSLCNNIGKEALCCWCEKYSLYEPKRWNEIKTTTLNKVDWEVRDVDITCDIDGTHFEVELEGHANSRSITFADLDKTKEYIRYKLNDDYSIQKTIYKLMLNSVYGAHSQHQLTKLGQPCEIRRVIFNDPATIVMWSDGTKTVVKCQEGDIFDPEKGLAMAISKKAFGNTGSYCDEIKKWTENYEYPKAKTIDNLKDSFAKINIPTFSAKEISDAVDYALKQFDKAMGVK